MTSQTWRAPHSMRSIRYVYIPMRDGVRLACDIYRPAGEGRFPCLMVRTCYNKNGMSKQAESYVRGGYVLCVVDARGSGGSEGEFTYYNLPGHATDGADVVNWLAAREFCDGRVGTFGPSALGFSQILTAAGRPEALKTMYVEIAPVNLYHDNWFPGGIFMAGQRIRWVEGMTACLGPAVAMAAVEGETDPAGERIRHQVATDRLALRDRRLLDGRCASPQDWMIPMRQATEYGPLWRDTYNWEQTIADCEIPTTYRGIWYDHFVSGTCRCYRLHRGPKRLIVNPGSQGTHGEHADLDIVRDQLRWFDHWLKGIDTGVMDEPPVRLFVMGSERWETFADWPPGTDTRTLALSDGGALVRPGQAEVFADVHTHDPREPVATVQDVQDIRDYEARALTYTTEPLTEDLRVIGEPVLKLHLRCSAPDAHVIVKLADVFPDGRSRQVTFGRLRAAHREGHEKVVPLPDSEAVELTIPLWPVANTFKAGHRIRLVLAGSDAPYSEVCPHPSECTILAPATVELPVGNCV